MAKRTPAQAPEAALSDLEQPSAPATEPTREELIQHNEHLRKQITKLQRQLDSAQQYVATAEDILQAGKERYEKLVKLQRLHPRYQVTKNEAAWTAEASRLIGDFPNIAGSILGLPSGVFLGEFRVVLSEIVRAEYPKLRKSAARMLLERALRRISPTGHIPPAYTVALEQRLRMLDVMETLLYAALEADDVAVESAQFTVERPAEDQNEGNPPRSGCDPAAGAVPADLESKTHGEPACPAGVADVGE